MIEMRRLAVVLGLVSVASSACSSDGDTIYVINSGGGAGTPASGQGGSTGPDSGGTSAGDGGASIGDGGASSSSGGTTTASGGANAGSAGQSSAGGTSPGSGGTAGSAGTAGSVVSGGAENGGGSGSAGTNGAGGSSGQGGTVVLFEDFEDSVPHPWADSFNNLGEDHGSWQVSSDLASVTAYRAQEHGDSMSWAAIAQEDWPNLKVEVDVLLLDDSAPLAACAIFVAAHFQSPQDTYRALLTADQQIRLQARIGGSSTTLNTGTIPAFQFSTWFKVTLVISGSNLSAYFNDSLVVEAQDASVASGGIGLGVDECLAYFDNVRVTVP